MVELEVAARFQCSQSTVREALLLLQEEGLVQRSPHRGTRVSVLTEDEALEMLRLRRDMECRAAQRLFAGTPAARPTSRLRCARNSPPWRRPRRGRRVCAGRGGPGVPSAAVRGGRLPNVEPLLLRCLIHNHRFKILNGRERHDLHHAARRHVPIIEAVEPDTAGLVAALERHA